MNKIAIIGSSYLQYPLIDKAKKMGLETHVFAWESGDIGERAADYFYPISIVEREAILRECERIHVDGICTIASDLAAITVGFVANALGLTCNTPHCVSLTTNKHLMRLAFEDRGDPSPKSVALKCHSDLVDLNLSFPIIIKPSDRSGSRGVFLLEDSRQLAQAFAKAKEESLSGLVLAEEYACGKEYSVEFISWKGTHHFLAITEKYTSGVPRFIERGHLEPAALSEKMIEKVVDVVRHALDTLGVENGASHSELKIDEEGNIRIIEIGARMGGDFIGSDLVFLSTGFDFLEGTVQIALGQEPNFRQKPLSLSAAGVRFILSKEDMDVFRLLQKNDPEMLIRHDIKPAASNLTITDSSTRGGYYLFASEDVSKVRKYMPLDNERCDKAFSSSYK